MENIFSKLSKSLWMEEIIEYREMIKYYVRNCPICDKNCGEKI